MPDVSCVCQSAAAPPSVEAVVIPVATVLVAAAVAAITYLNTTRQLAAARETARLNLIMPMREAWIGQLRGKISRYMAICAKVCVGERTKSDGEELLVLRRELQLMLDLRTARHAELDSALSEALNAAAAKPPDNGRFDESAKLVTVLGHEILKSEWQRTKAADS